MTSLPDPTFAVTQPDRISEQLADLRGRIDAIGRGGGSMFIAPGSLSGGVIAPGTMDPAELFGPGSVPGDVIIPGTLTVDRLIAGTITADYIAANTIVAGNIAAGTITAGNIAAGTITADRIATHTLTATQIAAGSITATEIAAGTITAGLIAAGTITATNIAAGTITSGLLASNAVTATAIATGAVTSTKISVADLSAVSAQMGIVTGGRFQTATSGQRAVIGDSIVTSAGTYTGIVLTDAGNNIVLLANAATGTLSLKGQILTGSSGLGNISGQVDGTLNITSRSISAGRLVLDTLTAAEIASGTITATEILANTITAGQIASGTITATQIAAGTITGDQISGTAIDGKVITGALLRTAATGTRIEFGGTASSVVTNPDFETNTTGWLTSYSAPNVFINAGATIARTTSQFHGGAASGQVDVTTVDQGVVTSLAPGGGFLAGTSYTASMWLRGNVGGETVQLTFGSAPSDAALQSVTLTTAWQQVSATWTPASAASTAYFGVRKVGASSARWFIDDIVVAGVSGAVGLRVYDSSNAQVVNLDGTSGLRLFSQTGGTETAVSSKQAVSFIDPAASSVEVGRVEALRYTGANDTHLVALTAPDSGAAAEFKQARLTTQPIGGSQSNAASVISACDNINNTGKVYVLASGAGGSRTTYVMTDAGTSDFLQLASTASHKIAFGTANLTFSANSDANITVAHGLGSTPGYVVASPRTAGSSALTGVACTARDSSNITLAARHYDNTNLSTTITVDWFAIA